MCGFAGEIRFDQRSADVGAVQRMSEVIAPRGPDAQGLFHQGRYAVGHRRLKIIDLSNHAEQPMVDRDLGMTIVFNGCIYNYKQLRSELEGLGYRFASTGDTEVVLKAFHAWGDDCMQRFHGMFAFVIHERDSGRVTMVRDRFGIKPLYTAPVAGGLRFASTLPALLAGGDIDTSIDVDALNHYMSWHAVVPPPRTILRGVRKLAPATIVHIDADGEQTSRTWWTLDVAADAELVKLPAAEREAMVEQALRVAVERRMVADVPVGVLLSGGVDSSLIVGLLAEAGQQHLQTFSIGFDAAGGEAGDEFRYSDLVAKRYDTDHHQIHIPTAELMDALPGTIAAMHEPMVSYDNVAFYLLSREVAKKTKVVQSGQGADEVFAGYHWYPKLAQANPADAVAAYRAAFFDRTPDEMAQMLAPGMLSGDASQELLQRHFDGLARSSPVEKALHIDTTVMLVDDPVKRVDSMTMAWGLEARVPFLDHELVELAGRLPADDKLAEEGKGVLKRIARRLLPREVVDRPKGYFPVPILKYIDGPVLEMIRQTMGNQAARERGIFNRAEVDRLLAEPAEHLTPLRGSKLWQVALLELWLQRHGI
ncbi:N-acetylglutaminylglutamine amidotransferase [Piscinibacter sakaiensis]|uniref:N-acetylglutaminylglutamine amidotransferase n=1 Tax=Piscinibacter sakaiensis TaxID=1547922 RepID=UPI003AACC283